MRKKAKGTMQGKILAWSLAAALGVLGATGTGALELSPERVVFLRAKIAISPATEEVREFKLLRLVGLSSTRFLALAQLRCYQIKPVDPEKAPSNPYVAPGKLEILAENLVLAVVNKDGKILLQSPPLPGNFRVRPLHPLQRGRVVAMEDNPHCPFALLRRDVPELHCFDWQLQPLARQSLPLPRVLGAQPVLVGERWELWVLGEQERGQAKSEGGGRPTMAQEFLTLPGEPALFRYRFDSRELLPVSWAGQAPREAVRRLVLGQSEKSLSLAGLQIVPVASFGAGEASQGVPLAITAVLQEKPGGFGEFVGKQVFLVATAGEQGLSGLRRLPLVILHEADRREVELDQEAGVLLVPEAALVEDLEIVALKDQRFAVYSKLNYAPEGAEKAEAQGFYSSQLSWPLAPQELARSPRWMLTSLPKKPSLSAAEKRGLG